MNDNAKKILKGIGSNIRYLRERNGLTQKQLAERTATIDDTAISRIEAGANHELATLIQISEALKVPLALLVLTKK